jgi:hypothetical protein
MTRSPEPVSLAKYRGEVTETGQPVTVNVPRRRKRRRGWRDHVGLVDYDVMTRLELTGAEYRILFEVLRAIPEKGGNIAFVTQQEIADRLNIAPPNVSKVMSALRKRHIVWPLKQRGRWQVNAWVAYNGDFDSWNSDAEVDPEPIWVRGVDPETGEVR